MGTVAANVAAHGTGGLNIDGCRIAVDPVADASQLRTMTRNRRDTPDGWGLSTVNGDTPQVVRVDGRWPANVLLDEDAAGMLGEPARFFYTAKASRREREAGLDGMPAGANRINAPRASEGEKFSPSANHHPTVKPIAVMRWLCRLVTPPNGLVLDPFTGSGTTGCAAVLEGFRFLGVEREAEYVEIATKRIAHWAAQTPEPDLFHG